MIEMLNNPFILTALYAGLMSSITGGVIGSYVVVKRIVFIAGSIAHSVLGGMGFCLWLSRVHGISWLTPLHGALIASILSALLLGLIHLHYKQREDTIIGVLWSTGMAIGVIFISLTPGYNVEITNYLFGNILWVSTSDLVTLSVLNAFLLIVVKLFYKKFMVICFDEKQAYLQGLSVSSLYLLLLTLVAISVVALIQVVGAILVITILSIPAAIAGTYTHRLSTMMLLAFVLSSILTTMGITVSYELNWPPGASIALLASLAYVANLLFKKKIT